MNHFYIESLCLYSCYYEYANPIGENINYYVGKLTEAA